MDHYIDHNSQFVISSRAHPSLNNSTLVPKLNHTNNLNNLNNNELAYSILNLKQDFRPLYGGHLVKNTTPFARPDVRPKSRRFHPEISPKKSEISSRDFAHFAEISPISRRFHPLQLIIDSEASWPFV